MRSLLLGVGLGLLASCLFIGGFASGAIYDRTQSPVSSSDPDLNDFLSAYRLVTQQSYYRPLNHHHLVYAAIEAMLAATGDPHTVFLSPGQNQEATREINGGRYAGIGIMVDAGKGKLRILTPLPNSPAQRAGLRPGDRVVSINGKAIASMPASRIIGEIQGRAGTAVRLTVARKHSATLTVSVRRAQIPPVTAYGRPLGHHLGYVQIFSFGNTTAQEVALALRAADRRGDRGIVLDLRGNPGGYVDAAQQIVSQFVPKGTVAYEKVASGRLNTLSVLPHHQITHVPVAVLVDGGTASAAEITAAALRDDDRAVLIGTRTYGKGSMQSVYTLPDGASVRITDRLWLTPRKRSIQQVGIKPTIAVSAASISAGGDKDTQLAAAEQYLRTHVER